MRKSFTLLACILFSALVFSQNKIGKISGTITDESKKPLQSVSVSLLRAKDSSLVKIAVTSKEGKYEFENINGIFPAVDRRYKFVLLVVDKTKVQTLTKLKYTFITKRQATLKS